MENVLTIGRVAEAARSNERRLESELTGRREVLGYRRRMLEETPMFDVEIKQIPAQRYASRTTNVRLSELEPLIVETIRELSPAGAEGPPFAIFHGKVNETDDDPVEVGVPRAGRGPETTLRWEVVWPLR